MDRKTFTNEEIHGFFKEIGLENETERQRILLQGIINPLREENKELTCILLDHSTVKENREDNNAKLEPNLR